MGWIRFSLVRQVTLGLCFVSAAAVVGVTAYMATLFNDKYDKPWIVFTLIVSALSLFVFAYLGFQYSFRTHIGIIGFMAILWLAVAAYTTDRIGYVQCESLDGQRRPKSNGGTYDDVAWCRETKAVMAFAWFNFAMLLIAIVSWIRLQEFEEHEGLGHEDEYEREPYRAAEAGNYVANGGRGGQYANGNVTGVQYANGMTGVGGYPQTTGPGGGTVVYQQPGHNIVLQNGQIRQVPVGAPIY